jgi:hypothetical protein
MLPEVESRIDASPESLDLALSDIDLLAAFRADCVARLLQLAPVFRLFGARFSVSRRPFLGYLSGRFYM